MPRPPTLCPCGAPIAPPTDGPTAARCPPCKARLRTFQTALANLRTCMADPNLRPPEAQRYGEELMAFGVRLRKDGSTALLMDAVETIDALAGRVDIEQPEKVARTLNAARERILYRVGLRGPRRRGAA